MHLISLRPLDKLFGFTTPLFNTGVHCMTRQRRLLPRNLERGDVVHKQRKKHDTIQARRRGQEQTRMRDVTANQQAGVRPNARRT